MIQFKAFHGKVINIEEIKSSEYEDGCVKMISLQNEEGAQVNFILTPDTYVLNQEMLVVGDIVTGYYDANAPTIMIFPPQYLALVMVKEHASQHVKVSYFNRELVSQDNQLKLNLLPKTQIVTANGQAFMARPMNRNLIVIYGPATKSIPAQTTPYYIVVLC